MFRSFVSFALAVWLSAGCAPCAGVGVRAETSGISKLIVRSEDPPAKRQKVSGETQDLEPLSPSEVPLISPEDAAALGRVLQNLDGIEAEFEKAMPPAPAGRAPGASPAARVCLDRREAMVARTLVGMAMQRAYFGDLLSGDVDELAEQRASDQETDDSPKWKRIAGRLGKYSKERAAKVRDAMRAFAKLREDMAGTDDAQERQRAAVEVEKLRNSIFLAYDTEIGIVLSKIRDAVSPASVDKACALPSRRKYEHDAGIDPFPRGAAGMSDDDAEQLRKIFTDPTDFREVGRAGSGKLVTLRKWEAFMNKVLTGDVGKLRNAHVSQGAYGASSVVDVPVVSRVSDKQKTIIANLFKNNPKDRQVLRSTISLFGSACELVDDEKKHKQQRHSKVLGAVFELLEEVRPTVAAVYQAEIEMAAGGS